MIKWLLGEGLVFLFQIILLFVLGAGLIFFLSTIADVFNEAITAF